MGELAVKRNKQAGDPHPRSFLCEALRAVWWYGRALFEAESRAADRKALGQWMRQAFPGDRFPFWKEQRAVPDKPFAEGFALLEALRELVENQSHRLAQSRSLARDPLREFRRLYRKELLACLPEDEVQSPWRLVARADAPSVDEDSHLEEDRDGLSESDAFIRVGNRIKERSSCFSCASSFGPYTIQRMPTIPQSSASARCLGGSAGRASSPPIGSTPWRTRWVGYAAPRRD